ncbi:hypothetical protein DFJ74DRAFT_657160 [Hyaloraphidium curvatum]|nr:hypothetical protein DFJ74DRAFT_657160 [Hyaloraphidium curvatum]
MSRPSPAPALPRLAAYVLDAFLLGLLHPPLCALLAALLSRPTAPAAGGKLSKDIAGFFGNTAFAKRAADGFEGFLRMGETDADVALLATLVACFVLSLLQFGKSLAGLRVVDGTGKSAPFGRRFLRGAARATVPMLSVLDGGLAAWTGRTVEDYVLGTTVVKRA